MSINHTKITSTNDSDAVVLTAGTGKIIELLSVHVRYTSTATAGNRQLVMIIQDESDTLVSDFHAGAVQAASLTRHYSFGRGVYRETSFVAESIQCPYPLGTVLLPGWDLRIQDEAGIDAAADDMVIDIMYKELSISKSGMPHLSEDIIIQ